MIIITKEYYQSDVSLKNSESTQQWTAILCTSGMNIYELGDQSVYLSNYHNVS